MEIHIKRESGGRSTVARRSKTLMVILILLYSILFMYAGATFFDRTNTIPVNTPALGGPYGTTE